MEERTKNQRKEFKVGDRVWSFYFGIGTVTEVQASNPFYQVQVRWGKHAKQPGLYAYFLLDGRWCDAPDDEERRIAISEGDDEEMGQIAGVIHHDVLREAREKMHAKGRKFKVGDRVFSFYYGYGVVERIADAERSPYPIAVRWEQDESRAIEPNTCNYYTVDGEFDADDSESVRDIFLMHAEEDESTVERMEDALNKKVEDAVNPSHYKVKGISEAHVIINHLMHREQYEGFLWGNIIKYAYRYGRKGDKAETAGKIVWYATKLKELEECEKE